VLRDGDARTGRLVARVVGDGVINHSRQAAR
jgi:hypothetical protein